MGTHGMQRTPVPARRARALQLGREREREMRWPLTLRLGHSGALAFVAASTSSLNASLTTHTDSNSFSFHGNLCFPVVLITVTKSSTVMLSTYVLSVFTSLSFPPILAAALEGVTNTKPILQVSKLRLSFTNRESHLPKVTQLSSDGDRNRSQI